MNHYKIKVLDGKQVVVERIQGFWTEQIAHQYIQDFEKKVEPVTAKNWALLTDLSEWQTSDQKIVDIISDHFDWNRNHKMTHNANILDKPLERNQLNTMFKSAGVEDICKVFATQEEAVDWLNSVGYKV